MTVQRRRAIVFDGLKAYESVEVIDIERFASRFNVSRRTIYRDIAALKAIGRRVPPYAYREAA